MLIFGKLFGGIFGALIYGPLGFIIGVGIGHLFDKGIELNARLSATDVIEAKTVFFKSIFLIMGYIAKLDGRISEGEIALARSAMRQLQLSSEQKMRAIEYFNLGKSPHFHFEATLDNFAKHCGHHLQLVQMFIEIQIQCALVDGLLVPQKYQALEIICQRLGVSPHFLHAQSRQGGYQRTYENTHEHQAAPRWQDEMANAYAVLGVNSSASFKQIKKAYRKLMSQHHPDKLVSKGLPPEMLKLATEKTQKIQKAFELIAKARGER